MEFNYTKNTVRRSRLIMPANAPKFVERAYLRNADAIVLDLEDSVPNSEKVATRALIKDLIPVVGKGGSDVFVRVNNVKELLKDDIEASVWPGVEGIYLPKVESTAEVHGIEKLIAELEKKRGIPVGQIKISVLIESAKGYVNLNEIAKASERIDTLSIGNEDFLRDVGMVECADTYHALLVPRTQLVLIARAHCKMPMGLIGSLANYSDPNAFEQSAALAYKHGYLGASCIHPGNVEVLNKCFTPGIQEVEHAKKVMAAFDEAVAAGRASATFEGKMIDYVHYEKAKTLLDRYAVVEAFEQKKQKARELVGV
ncbi:HpcH/HpaI aldolase/citrate lyase family protein [Pelosinus propionicus]|uniref:Citrate lyase subunit beta / citryl-CoA lyase n=1 Tax=Pelosinus propionicus DSM 13327 TaxID=1123291 RepID=A0A1I4H294_9FIRM|nr:CoA ester lyase [Pelosinus propionicus]SFL36305.1 citrate lyase subunit beta / citryl-CoA lyase [Pelosinus propionicus DSM 13327]